MHHANPSRSIPILLAVVLLGSALAAVAAEPAPAPPPPAPPPATAPAAAAADGFTLAWWTVDGGGGTSTGGAFAVTGALGQPDAGAAASHGQVLDGGFWSGNRETIFFGDFELGDTARWSAVTP